MKRALIAATIAASFFTTNLLAAEAVGPLAPGKPAGVAKAQGDDHTPLYLILGGLAIGLIVIGANAGGSSAAAASSSSSSTSTSTTTTTAATTTTAT